MKPLAAALGTLLLLTACAHGPTTTTTSVKNASGPSPIETPARGDATGAASSADTGRRRRRGTPNGSSSSNAGTTDRGTATNGSGSQPAASSAAASRSTAANTRKPIARTVPKPAPAPVMPQILGASVSPTVVGSGSTVSATVRTTPGVVSVVAYAGGMSMAVPRVGSGVFAGSTTLPPLPPFAHGSYAVTFVARDASGRSTQSAVGVTVR